MKKKSILLVVLAVLALLSSISGIKDMQHENLKEDNIDKETIALSFSPKQCVNAPWEEWYAKGEINFIKEPTQEELIKAYYSSKEIEILNLSQEFFEGFMCQACEICIRGNTFHIRVLEKDSNLFLNEGWSIEE